MREIIYIIPYYCYSVNKYIHHVQNKRMNEHFVNKTKKYAE